MKLLTIQQIKTIGTLVVIFCLSLHSFSQINSKKISSCEEIILKSTILNETRNILVSLPENYNNSDKSFPVLYILDGRTHFSQAIGATNFLASQGFSPEIIVVAISNTIRNRDLSPIYDKSLPTSGGGEKFHNFLEKELIPHIEKSYRSSNYKILMGHSLGGLFTAYSLLEFPEVFNSYIAVSPYLQYNNKYIVTQAKSKSKLNYSKTPTFYMTVGNEPNYFESLNEFSTLVKEISDNNIKFEYIEMQNENHGTTPYLSLFNGLRFIFSDWMISKETIAKGLPSVDAHFKKLTEQYDYEITTSENIINFLGYQYLKENELEKAIKIFKENIKRFPKSANVYDSLGEAYEKNGKIKLARENYQKAYDLGTKQNHRATEIFQKNLLRVSN